MLQHSSLQPLEAGTVNGYCHSFAYRQIHGNLF
ncbi:hypothetical protein LA635_p1028 (plasmid) [Erwinia amylovora LA635]|uniref:Uncharacterized protein n=1 Tax=Erwinia amylovora TaxID=552 RepID=A0A0P0ZGH0_ERWAM|nr:hypothetical protein LA635_p1028 [Erwinia amylovora LA635]CDK23805.1 hypothetical protein LA636_p1027 [Erwinia amylovora LA636]CDK23855.1 hypothetical protein LA637_p1028 [Erwinia amylovora LA637]CDM08153.1 hypothetical protein EAMY692_p20027 [Erwinia amylovora]